MKFLFILASLFLSASAFAADSGCGLGSVIIQKNSKGLQLLSWTTNGVLFTQPLGITSGTSGCSSSGLVNNDKQMQYFVEINNDDLAREMARGEGEKLQVLAQLSGCRNSEAQKKFMDMTKRSFGEIYPSPEEKAENVISRIKDRMKNDTDIMGSCELASL